MIRIHLYLDEKLCGDFNRYDNIEDFKKCAIYFLETYKMK
ncbi:hypothetical protein CNEO2_20124 [Clostridium neonatale]|uniref:Uncharacterized protein n=1 Tax=Clostridium neonatale TaxID=137838 RepID=A0AAD1YIR9_9CLOT|nr:hypothetical protein CNEO2_90056 [Clostridium neonatale]CAI3215123.1 hypothetical protein CNEO2_70086 [Clostridium neonatale]CAI3561271.1 hypothetical protein CNEO4_120084 [Clostridium neonatale]CAI3614448.1 hypothetical protein CNEO4_210033 [Clostridium neonatale]CAI3618014.1 hypothetical protein CNEO2_20124 [Clostridium neonatale]